MLSKFNELFERDDLGIVPKTLLATVFGLICYAQWVPAQQQSVGIFVVTVVLSSSCGFLLSIQDIKRRKATHARSVMVDKLMLLLWASMLFVVILAGGVFLAM